jgi:NADH:ubiquinone oxidoreductase subunit F (NADH-binding)/NADH:ubiquinone oxidoreductase subunit E
VPGRTVTELERRLERPATEVLDRLRAVAVERGRIEGEDIDRVAAELGLPRAHVNGAASFFSDLAPTPRGRRHVQVCAGTACFAASSGEHLDATAAALGAPLGGVSADGECSLQPVYCLGYCYGGPAALDGGEPCAGADLVAQLSGEAERSDPEIPFSAEVAEPVVLAGLAGGEGQWQVWPEVADAGDRDRVSREVSASGLRGRGGAGFPASVKWSSAAESPSDGPRYLICNGDEGDPGSFVDRLLMEHDPHRVLEGMALAAFAARATHGFVYVRSEYPRAAAALRGAVEEARAGGHLGTDVHGSGWSFDIEVFEGAGSYVAGEETSLIHSMEGLRGEVTARPPFPTERGFLNRPTVVNNVETLCSVPWIVGRGGSEYARLGMGDSRGTKVVCLNERFRNPGAYEVELGVGLDYIFDGLGGGLREEGGLRAVQVGGPLGGFVSASQLDTPLSFEALREIGADLGHGSIVAVDARVSGAELLEHIWNFAAAESCGTCAPCRIGTKRGQETARDATMPADEYARLLRTMELGSLCAFGKTVPQAVRSVARACDDLPDPVPDGR